MMVLREEIIAAAFIGLSAAYDALNYRLLTKKSYECTRDSHLTRFIRNLLENRRFFVTERVRGGNKNWVSPRRRCRPVV